MSEPIIPVPMTIDHIAALRLVRDEMPRGWHAAHEAITDLCARYQDAAAARAAEPVRVIDAYRCITCGAIEYDHPSLDRRPAWPWHFKHDSHEWCDGELFHVTINTYGPMPVDEEAKWATP
jgi:hypothetical protein